MLANLQILLAMIGQAHAAGLDAYVLSMTRILHAFFNRVGHWHEWMKAEHLALDSAERSGDLRDRARTHTRFGRACTRLNQLRDADRHLRLALDLYRELDDANGQGDIHRWLGDVCDHPEGRAEALQHSRLALELYRSTATGSVRRAR